MSNKEKRKKGRPTDLRRVPVAASQPIGKTSLSRHSTSQNLGTNSRRDKGVDRDRERATESLSQIAKPRHRNTDTSVRDNHKKHVYHDNQDGSSDDELNQLTPSKLHLSEPSLTTMFAGDNEYNDLYDFTSNKANSVVEDSESAESDRNSGPEPEPEPEPESELEPEPESEPEPQPVRRKLNKANPHRPLSQLSVRPGKIYVANPEQQAETEEGQEQ